MEIVLRINSFFCILCSHCMRRNLMEDVEAHETLIIKEQEELEEKKKIIELKEVCVCVCVGLADRIIYTTNI